MSKVSKTASRKCWKLNTALCVDLKTILLSDRKMKMGKEYQGSLRPNFKPMKVGQDFSLERYAFGVYLELYNALKGLVGKNLKIKKLKN